MKPFTLTLDTPEAFRGVHEALQQYLDNQDERDDNAMTPEAQAVEALVAKLDQALASLAAEASEVARDALVAAVRYFEAGEARWKDPARDHTWLREALDAYEATGDHDHGAGRLKPGAPCAGGDCLIAKARELLRRKTDRLPAPEPGKGEEDGHGD